VDIDWPTYAGKKRHLPWYLLAAKCLAQNGVRIFMHGGGAHTAGRLYSEQLLDLLGIPLCRNWQSVEIALEQHNLAFMPLGDWAPQLQRMIDLRNTLGLRSPIHSLARILNPLGARCGLQSIFHPGYQGVHRDASSLLGDTSIVIKGDGGEIEINPDTISHLYGTRDGQPWDEEWPALSLRRHVKPATLDPLQLVALWRGEIEDSYPQLALISTIALALRGLGMPRDRAFEQAQIFWEKRNTSI
jgi:anthranilate phosphoribosyltransferase